MSEVGCRMSDVGRTERGAHSTRPVFTSDVRSRTAGTSDIGMSLLEVLVVVTLIAVIGGVVFPSVASGLDTLRLKSSADRLASTFRYARERALWRQVACQVTLDPARHVVEFEDLSDDGERRSWELPPEILVGENRPRVFVFAPDGGAANIGVVLRTRRGRSATIQFDVLSALPRVKDCGLRNADCGLEDQ